MVAALRVRRGLEGTDLLIAHCVLLGRLLQEERPPAAVRLERALGRELARLLSSALVQDQGRRGRSSP